MTRKILSSVLLLALVGCASKASPGLTKVTGPSGQVRAVPTPTKFIVFQGSDITVKGLKLTMEESSESSADKSKANESKEGEEGSKSGTNTNKNEAKLGAKRTAELGEFTRAWKTRDVSDLAVALDNAQYSSNVLLVASASVDNEGEYKQKLGKVTDSQEKLGQLSLIVSSKDSAALGKWLDHYFDGNKVLDNKPVTNTTLGLGPF
jgi:hypothetical protein